MNEEFEDSINSFTEKLKITFIQISGMCIGYTVIISLNMFEEDF